MTLEQLIFQIRKKGCNIVLIDDITIPEEECDGLFDVVDGEAIIKLAIKGKNKSRLRYILLHEYAHYLQWVEGFMAHIERNIDGWVIFDEWLKGKRFSRKKLTQARNAMLLLEYDADVRMIELAKDFGIRLGRARHIREANSYAALIKWGFATKTWLWLPAARLFLPTMHTPNTLLGPLTDKENAVFNACAQA